MGFTKTHAQVIEFLEGLDVDPNFVREVHITSDSLTVISFVNNHGKRVIDKREATPLVEAKVFKLRSYEIISAED